ncbi:translation initiation factor IF-2 [Pedobacter sp. UYEF25]
MSDDKPIILIKAIKELNIAMGTAVEFLNKKGFSAQKSPMFKLSPEMYGALLKEYQGDKSLREEAKQIVIGKIRRDGVESDKPFEKAISDADFEKNEEILIKNTQTFAAPVEKPKVEPPAPEVIPAAVEKAEVQVPVEEKKPEEIQTGVKVVGRIDLNQFNGKSKQNKTAEEVIPQPKAPEVPELPKPPVVSAPVVEKTPVEKITPAETTPAVQELKSVEQKKVEIPNIVGPKAVVPIENKGPDILKTRTVKLTGPNIVGKITLPTTPERRGPIASSNDNDPAKRKRKRKKAPNGQAPPATPGQAPPSQPRQPYQGNRPVSGTPYQGNRGKPAYVNRNTPSGPKAEPTEKEIQDQIKATLARLSGAGKSGKFAQRAKLRRQKRDDVASTAEEAQSELDSQAMVLKVTEFVTANELANMMDVPVTKIIGTCMSLGMFVSINQRLDAETLTIVADEFGYEIQFVKPDEDEENIIEVADNPEDLVERAPVVTIMGHVDHGKTSLLDYIREANVVAGEAGGITQHIGAYMVTTPTGKKVTFLDTPGHEAFTAMRARGAKAADIAIIVVAADDAVMPQTKEAINHAQAAGVPLVFAFTKIDKPGANSDKVREQLSVMNILVEDWGGKFQSQEISSKTGLNIDILLDKVLLEAELLELTANPKKRAVGTVIESALDKGRGIVTTVLVQAGELKVGDPILAGSYSGRVKALFNERGVKVDSAGPSQPVQVLGMQGAPTAGDRFNAVESESEARDIATKRMQLQREQGLRTQKHITLDEIGRRLAIGNFKELNIIVKGDVDGSIEALSDSLLKLSTEQIQINVISKGVGQISESDVLLATASDAIIIGFQVRPSSGARKLAEQEQIDIRLYSIIYDAIDEIKSAMEGMLDPIFEEKIVANVEIRETFKITKVGTIAGCMVLDGKINRNSKIRIVRDGVVVYTGELASLKRFKDDVKEVSKGYECGLNIQNFNNIEIGDIVEAYEQVEVKNKL